MIFSTEATPVFLALGTNQGDRIESLRSSLKLLGGKVEIIRQSSVYETAPAYVLDQAPFLNMVVEGRTVLDPQALLRSVKDVERQVGRTPSVRWGPRVIDIDILLYGDRTWSLPDLTIPHPRLHERPFVLVPLAEIAPDLVPPGFDISVADLARKAPPVGDVLARVGQLEESGARHEARKEEGDEGGL